MDVEVELRYDAQSMGSSVPGGRTMSHALLVPPVAIQAVLPAKQLNILAI